MDYNQFAETIKQKYPEYKDKDNLTLAKAIVDKHPEYSDRVTFEQPLKADEQGNAPVDAKGNAVGTTQQQIDFERGGFNKFSTNPVGQRLIENASEAVGGMGTAELGLGLAKGALKIGAKQAVKLAPEIGKTLESVGAKGQNFAANLRPQTIEAMTSKAMPNPGDIGVKVGSKLAEDGIVGSTPKETFDNLITAKDKAGKAVGKAIEDIHGNGLAAINANEALTPLKESMDAISGAMTSARRKMAKPFKEVYDRLVTRSQENGMLSLDDIKSAMKEVGPMTHKGAEETQAVMSELYGTLANVQDKIVTSLAKAAKKPELRDALLKANENFSLYSRIAPDLERAAAKEAVGKSSVLAHPLEAMKHFAATKASGFLNRQGVRMKGLNKAFDTADMAALRDKLKYAK